MEDEGAEEAILSEKPRSLELGFPSLFLRARVGSKEFTGRKKRRF